MDCEGEILSRQVNGVIYHYECCNLLASHMFFSSIEFSVGGAKCDHELTLPIGLFLFLSLFPHF